VGVCLGFGGKWLGESRWVIDHGRASRGANEG
jgi:hypothetical protein